MNREGLLREIRLVYENRRQSASRKAEARDLALNEEQPALAKAQELTNRARWNYLARLTVPDASDSAETASLAEELAQAEASLSQIQEELGLPEEDLSIYACATCRDTGRVSGHICPKCYPDILRETLRHFTPGLLPDEEQRFRNHRPDLFSDAPLEIPTGHTTARRQMDQNVETAKKLIDDFPDPSVNLYFTGKPGTGKTFLASCIANRLLDQGHFALLLTMLQFEEITAHYRTLQLTYGVSAEALTRAEEAYQFLLDADLLVLDDFGVSSGLLKEPLSEIIMLLHQRKIRGRQTIITTNMSLKDLRRQYDERLLSRILSSLKIIPFLGDDLRLRRGHV